MRTLIAGVGNIFFGDDGFGPEVARRMCATDLAGQAKVVDYGIRGAHLAYDLLDGWDSLVLVDTVPARGCPGRLHVIEVDAGALSSVGFDPHDMVPHSVLSALANLGGTPPPTHVVGCEPAVLEGVIGLSPAVAAAVPEAISTIQCLVRDLNELAQLHASPLTRQG